MEKPKTEETAQGTSEVQDPEASAAVVAEEKAPEKVDLDRIIDGDTEYAAQQLEKAAAAEGAPDVEPKVEGQPASASAAEPAEESDDDPVVLTLRNRGKTEPIRRSQAENRIQQAAHLQTLYETEAAPVLKVLRSNPVLAQAFADAARGDESGVRRILTALTGAPATAGKAPEQGEEPGPKGLEVDQRVVKLMRADPKFAGYTDDDLQVLAAVGTAQRQAREFEQTERETAEEQELSSKREVFFDALGSTDPSSHAQVIAQMPLVLQALKENLESHGKGGEYYGFIKAIRDPRNKDVNGKSLLATFYYDVRTAVLESAKNGGAAPVQGQQAPAQAAAAPAGKTPLRAIIGGRLEPGAPSSAARSGSLPSLAGKTREQRMAMFDSLMQ